MSKHIMKWCYYCAVLLLVVLTYFSWSHAANNRCNVESVAVANFHTFHVDVYTSFLYALSQVPVENVTLYRELNGFGMDTIIQSWFKGRVSATIHSLEADYCDYDYVIFITPPDESRGGLMPYAQKKCARPVRMAVLIHDSRQLPKDDVIQVAKPRLFTISPHMLEPVRSSLPRSVVVDFIAPVFPYYPKGWNDTGHRRGIVVQGMIDRTRRNYEGLMQQILQHPELRNSSIFPVTFLGAAPSRDFQKFSIPVEIENNKKILKLLTDNPPFETYYQTFAESMVSVPLFAHRQYTVNLASSTIGASIVALTPLIVEEQVLEAYSYVWQSAVILVDSENIVSIAKALSEVDYASKLRNLHLMRDELLLQNIRKMRSYLFKDCLQQLA